MNNAGFLKVMATVYTTEGRCVDAESLLTRSIDLDREPGALSRTRSCSWPASGRSRVDTIEPARVTSRCWRPARNQQTPGAVTSPRCTTTGRITPRSLPSSGCLRRSGPIC